jgi:hypothetical protein
MMFILGKAYLGLELVRDILRISGLILALAPSITEGWAVLSIS